MQNSHTKWIQFTHGHITYACNNINQREWNTQNSSINAQNASFAIFKASIARFGKQNKTKKNTMGEKIHFAAIQFEINKQYFGTNLTHGYNFSFNWNYNKYKIFDMVKSVNSISFFAIKFVISFFFSANQKKFINYVFVLCCLERTCGKLSLSKWQSS